MVEKSNMGPNEGKGSDKCSHLGHFTRWHHLKPPLSLPPCPQNTVDVVATPQTPLSTTPMPSKHI